MAFARLRLAARALPLGFARLRLAARALPLGFARLRLAARALRLLRETCDRGRELRRTRHRVGLALRGDEHAREVTERREAERLAVRDLLGVERLVVVVA